METSLTNRGHLVIVLAVSCVIKLRTVRTFIWTWAAALS